MARDECASRHVRWAHFRFSVVGHLLAAPPSRGELQDAIKSLAATDWIHPLTGQPRRFAFSTIEKWYYDVRNGCSDPVEVLRKKVRKDSGIQRAISDLLKVRIREQFRDHPGWSYQLHHDNVRSLAQRHPELEPIPSYSTLVRYMKKNGLYRRRGFKRTGTTAGERAERRLQEKETRSYEADYVNGLWHSDFHECSRSVLTSRGEWVKPHLLAFLDDRSRLGCHAQWYLRETAENLVHGLGQAIQKRGLPRRLMTDNGSAMKAGETVQGLKRLGIVHCKTLEHSPHQNAKAERFWATIEDRLLAMLENVEDLDLKTLNDATQAYIELDYNREIHGETGQTPLERFLAGPTVARPSPSCEALREAIGIQERRTQRRGDGTVSIEGVRYEIPGQYRHLKRLLVRYVRWDLRSVRLIDPATDSVICRIVPVDKSRNSSGDRRSLLPIGVDPESVTDLVDQGEPSREIAPLLASLMADYAATGLPPAYLPKEDGHGPTGGPDDPDSNRDRDEHEDDEDTMETIDAR